MDRWRGKVAVVTGASSGIGACICMALVDEGLQVVGLARRVEKVQEASKKLAGKPGKLHAVKCDVSNQADVTKAFKWIQDNVGPVHILVNNAGLFKTGSILEGNPNDWRTVLDINVLGLTLCSQQAMRQMQEHGVAGHIIHINSVAGHTPMAGKPPVLNLYSPSKHAVTALTDIMRQEMSHYKLKIKITSISPGLVDTEIFETASFPLEVDKMVHLKAKDISDATLYVLGTPPHVQVQELTVSPLGENIQDY